MTSSKHSFASLCVVLDGVGLASSNLGLILRVIQRFQRFTRFFLAAFITGDWEVMDATGIDLGGLIGYAHLPGSARGLS
jgi:hypothetical protein